MDLKDQLQNIWKNKAARWAIIIGVLALIAWFASHGLGSSSADTEPKKRNIKKEVMGQAQGKVFEDDSLIAIDRQQNEETYDAMKKDLSRRDKEMKAALTSKDKQLDALSNSVAQMKSQMSEMARVTQLMATNNALSYQQNSGRNGNVPRAQDTGMSVPAQAYQQNAAGSPLVDSQGRATIVNPQMQTITRSPEANGIIRTISHRKVSQIKKSGEIEEKPVQVVYVDAKNQKKTDGKTAKSSKEDPADKYSNPEIKAKKRSMAREKSQSYIPSGSIISGVMLNGVDAPTSLSKNATPLPVTVRVKLDVLMPNNYRADLQDCNITGSVTGDLASERAYIRAVSLSCINENGESIETGMAGYAVSDYDGRNGVRGRVVNRAGKALIATFGASFLSGIAQATKPTAISSYDSTGSETTRFQAPNMTDVTASATMNGVAGGSDRLAKYFIAIAEAQWPVIEVSPGTPITFMLEKGMALPVND